MATLTEVSNSYTGTCQGTRRPVCIAGPLVWHEKCGPPSEADATGGRVGVGVTHRRRPDPKLNKMEEPECSGQNLGTGSKGMSTRWQVAGWQADDGSYRLCLLLLWYRCWLPSPPDRPAVLLRRHRCVVFPW